MDKYTEPEIRQGRGKGGCTVLFFAILALVGLAMWFMLWGRSVPNGADSEMPAVTQPAE